MKLLIAIFFSIKVYAQDSVSVKILYKPVTKGDTTYYTVKIGKEKVVMRCCCKDRPKREKGEYVNVAIKDIEFIKPDY